MAAEGTRLTTFYVASPTCTVSRASLLTGQLSGPSRADLATADRPGEEPRQELGPGPVGQRADHPYYLKPQGYATACFGKWNVGFAPGTRPTERGFDKYFGNVSGNMDYYTHEYQGRNDLFRGTKPEPNRGVYSTELFTGAACDFIRRHAHDPFFIYVPFNAVHVPVDKNFDAEKKLAVWEAPDEAFAAYGFPRAAATSSRDTLPR